MERVLCKETNKQVSLIHQGFDIAIIKRDFSDNQESVDVRTLAIKKRQRPKKFKF
jgi:hypothetical protein